jgi:hypothetical protein
MRLERHGLAGEVDGLVGFLLVDVHVGEVYQGVGPQVRSVGGGLADGGLELRLGLLSSEQA